MTVTVLLGYELDNQQSEIAYDTDTAVSEKTAMKSHFTVCPVF